MGAGCSSGRALLLVEDDIPLREAIAFVLSGEEYQVVEASTGEEALALIEKDGPFSGLYTDIGLPGLVDGWQVGQAFHQRWPTRGIVYASGRDWSGVRLPPRAVFLRKPFQLHTLIGALAASLGSANRNCSGP